MAVDVYAAYNGTTPLNAALAPVTTGTAVKTLLQIAPPSTENIRVIEWGISFDGTTAATPIKVELVETDVAATVTAHVAAGVVKWGDPNAPASNITLGTAATGFTASAEGTATAARLLDYQLVAPTNQYVKFYPLGREPIVLGARFLRIRVTAGTAVNAVCYVVWEE